MFSKLFGKTTAVIGALFAVSAAIVNDPTAAAAVGPLVLGVLAKVITAGGILNPIVGAVAGISATALSKSLIHKD